MAEISITTRAFYGNNSKRLNKAWQQKMNKLEKCAREFEDNPILLKRQRINDPPPIFKTFPRQQMAFDYLKTCQEDVHVFAKEKDCHGKRGYIVVTLPYFWHKYTRICSSEDRNYYEVIPEGAACRLYFDLEFKTEFNPLKDGASMVDIFIKYVCHHLKNMYGVDCDRKFIIDLDSSTSSKFSRHLIFHLPGSVFKDNIHAGNFVRHICTLLEIKLRVGAEFSVNKDMGFTCNSHQPTMSGSEVSTGNAPLPENAEKICEEKELESLTSVSLQELRELVVKDGKGEVGIFCDQGVYTKNRNFRIFKSTKIGKDSHLILSSQNTYEPSFKDAKGSFSKDPEYLLFLDSLVSNVSMQVAGKDVKVLTCGNCEKSCKRSSRMDARDSSSPSQHGYEHSPYPEIDNFILSVLNKGGVQGQIRRWVYFPQGKLVTYDVINNRWCENIGRAHKSNNVMIVADLRLGVYYQKCHDPDCRRIDYRSPEKPIPQEINPLSSCEFDEFLTDDFDDQELCKLLSECEQKPNDSGNDEMEEILNTNENNMNKNCVSRTKQDVTQFDISGYVTQHQVSDCDYDNDLDDELLLELQIPEHCYDNKDAVSHRKSLKDHNKYILQSCHDNENYTNEILKLLHGESNQTKLSETVAMDLSSNYVICQDETHARMNGKCMCSGVLPENNCADDVRVKFLTDEEVSEWLDEESLDDLELSLAAEEAESTA